MTGAHRNFNSQGSVSSTLTRLMVFSDCPLCRSIAGSAIVKNPNGSPCAKYSAISSEIFCARDIDARLLVRHLHQQLAEVAALEQSHERLRRILQAARDVLAVLDASGLHPLTHVVDERGLAIEVAGDDEALHLDLPHQEQAQHLRAAIGALRQTLGVVLRN